MSYPSPKIVLQHAETVHHNGNPWRKWHLDVTNYTEFEGLFKNTDDRTRVSIYDGVTNRYIYGFISFSEAKDLNLLWFGQPVADEALNSVYIKIFDPNKSNVFYQSNTLDLSEITVSYPSPKIALQRAEIVHHDGNPWRKWHLDVTNYTEFEGLFKNVDDRTRVSIYDGVTNRYIYGFSSFSEAKDLNLLWFGQPATDEALNSVYIKIFDPNDSKIFYQSNTLDLPEFHLLYGAFDYTFFHIDNIPNSDTSPVIYEGAIQVMPGSPVLCAAIFDHSGFAEFPEGAIVTIKDPTGTPYDLDKNEPEVYVKTVPTNDDSRPTSLFALTVINPMSGDWYISIEAPANVAFIFQLQAYPSNYTTWTLENELSKLDLPDYSDKFYPQGLKTDIGWAFLGLAAIVVISGAVGVLAVGTSLVIAAELGAVGGTLILTDKPNRIDEAMNRSIPRSSTSGESIPPLASLSIHQPATSFGNLLAPKLLTEGLSTHGLLIKTRPVQGALICVQFKNQTVSSLKPGTLADYLTGDKPPGEDVFQFFWDQSNFSFDLKLKYPTEWIPMKNEISHYEHSLTHAVGFTSQFYQEIIEWVDELDGFDLDTYDILYIVTINPNPAAGQRSHHHHYYYQGEKDITHFVTFTEPEYKPENAYKIFIHETGHALGLPDLYKYGVSPPANTNKVGSWDFMSNNRKARNFLGWHHHKLEWLKDYQEVYLNDNAHLSSTPIIKTYNLVPLGAPLPPPPPRADDPLAPLKVRDVYLIAIYGNKGSEERPDEVFVLEVAQPTDETPNPDGVLIYRVNGITPTGQEPVEIIRSHGRSLLEAPYQVSETYKNSFARFSVKINKKIDHKFEVKIVFNE